MALLVGFGGLSLLPDDTGERLPLGISLSCCALMALIAWAHSRMRVELGPDVRITNFFRTLVFPWDDIRAFEYENGALVLLSDGHRLRISVFQPGPRSLPYIERQCRDAVRQMENRRKSRG